MWLVGGCGTYRNVVEIWQEKQNAENSDYGQEDTAHGCFSAGTLVHQTSSISTKGGNAHEESSKNVCNAKSDQLAISRDGHVDDAISLFDLVAVLVNHDFDFGGTIAKAFCGDTAFEKAKEGDEERGGECIGDVFHHRWLERKMNLERLARRLQISKDIEALFVPGKAPS